MVSVGLARTGDHAHLGAFAEILAQFADTRGQAFDLGTVGKLLRGRGRCRGGGGGGLRAGRRGAGAAGAKHGGRSAGEAGGCSWKLLSWFGGERHCGRQGRRISKPRRGRHRSPGLGRRGSGGRSPGARRRAAGPRVPATATAAWPDRRLVASSPSTPLRLSSSARLSAAALALLAPSSLATVTRRSRRADSAISAASCPTVCVGTAPASATCCAWPGGPASRGSAKIAMPTTAAAAIARGQRERSRRAGARRRANAGQALASGDSSGSRRQRLGDRDAVHRKAVVRHGNSPRCLFAASRAACGCRARVAISRS